MIIDQDHSLQCNKPTFGSELSADLICQPLSNFVETATRLNALYIYLVMQNGDIIYILYVYTHSDMLLVFMLA